METTGNISKTARIRKIVQARSFNGLYSHVLKFIEKQNLHAAEMELRAQQVQGERNQLQLHMRMDSNKVR